MVNLPCSLQTSLDYDLDNIVQSTPLSPAHIFAINLMREKCCSKLPPQTRAERKSADKEAYDVWKEAQADNLRDCHPLRHHYDAKLRSIIEDFLYESSFSIHEVFSYANVGPGSTVGDRYDESASFLSKFAGSVTYTNPDLVRLFNVACSSDSRWLNLFQEIDQSGRFCKVKGGKASFVPKTRKISRMVVTPPLLNGFIDRGVGGVLESALVRQGINLSVRPDVNRELAMKGSLSGEFATIDLEGASSRLAYTMVSDLVPHKLAWWIRLTRPDYVSVQGKWEKMTELQTMGSGITFPFQTLFFLALARLSYDITGLSWHTNGPHMNVSVFGDDIIVHRRAFGVMTQLLRVYGGKTNVSKTFNEGPFRESCGADWFDGVNVRPVYIKSIRSLQDRFTATNLLMEWSLRLGLPALTTLIGTVMRWDIREVNFVPQHAPEFAGIRVPLDFLRVRRNEYTAFAAIPSTIRVTGDIVGSAAFMLALLRGDLRPSYKTHVNREGWRWEVARPGIFEVAVRVDKPRYIRVAGVRTGCWDASPFTFPQEPDCIVPIGLRRKPVFLPRSAVHQVGFGRAWDVNPMALGWITLRAYLLA